MLKSILSDTLGDRLGALLEPPAGLEFDYARPLGEAALAAPDSVSWRVFKNPFALFIGGVAAVILELAEPSVRAGVWDHSSFRREPLLRLRRTGAAAMMTVYGPASAAERMIAGVVRAHERVRGVNAEGDAYHANDPRLLDWVQATATYGFVEAYSQFVSPLSEDERSRAFAEARPAARLYGASGAPGSVAEWRSLLDHVRPGLAHSDVLEEFLTIMGEADIAPPPLRPLQKALIRAAFEIVPPEIRLMLHLEDRRLSSIQLAAVRTAARAAEQVPVRSAPPVQASIRVGRPSFHLYGRQK